jgi:hypothetical protein
MSESNKFAHYPACMYMTQKGSGIFFKIFTYITILAISNVMSSQRRYYKICITNFCHKKDYDLYFFDIGLDLSEICVTICFSNAILHRAESKFIYYRIEQSQTLRSKSLRLHILFLRSSVIP